MLEEMSTVYVYEIDPKGDVFLILSAAEGASRSPVLLDEPPPAKLLSFRRDYNGNGSKPGELLTEDAPKRRAVDVTVHEQEDFEELGDQGHQKDGGHPIHDHAVTNTSKVRIRVSSWHLSLASAYFRRCFDSGMKESQALTSHGTVDIELEDFDADAVLIAIYIIHGRTRCVPKTTDLRTLANIAVIVDYLECHESLETYTDKWSEDLYKYTIPEIYTEDLIRWICIAIVFNKSDVFCAATKIAIHTIRSHFEPLGLPITQTVIAKHIPVCNCEVELTHSR